MNPGQCLVAALLAAALSVAAAEPLFEKGEFEKADLADE